MSQTVPKTISIIVFIAISALAENCDDLGVLIYEDLGCTPQKSTDGKSSCPKKYDCVGLEKWTDKCYFRGKTYEIGKSVDSALSSPSCDQGCVCTPKEGNSSGFTCAILDCPEWLGNRPGPGCYSKYDLGKCCSTGQICEPLPDDLAKCTFEGAEYKEEVRFYPKDGCLECVCQKGFKGELKAPFCRRLSCGLQLKSSTRAESVQNSCGPIYGKKDEKRCCPHSWVCPNGSETFEGLGESEETCKYGEKTLKVGQSFDRVNVSTLYGTKIPKVHCQCLIPPLVSCIEVE